VTDFATDVFTEVEQQRLNGAKTLAGTAKRWAAKACSKKRAAPGLRMGIGWKDMAVSNLRTS
jgi:holo-[acyl-carrier protein] synthase